MPLDPGVRLGGPFSTATAQHIRRKPNGQVALMPYEYHYIGDDSPLARGVSSFLHAANPISQVEGIYDQDQAGNASMRAYQAMTPKQRDLYIRAALAPDNQPGMLEGMRPRSAEDIGALLAALIPVRLRGTGRMMDVDVNTVHRADIAHLPPGSMERIVRWLAEPGPIVPNLRGQPDLLPFGYKATTAHTGRGDLVAGVRWENPFEITRGPGPIHADHMYIHPALRGNMNLFLALASDMVGDTIHSQLPLQTFFANDRLRRDAVRYFLRRGFTHQFGPNEYDTFTPPRYP